MEKVVETLRERGLIENITHDEIVSLLKSSQNVYCGFDPTADSLHLGNLVGIIVLKWFQKFGHRPVVVLGGATARIGDPSGKSIERPLLDEETIDHNVAEIQKHFEAILDFSDPKTKPLILNNNDWFSQFSFIEFMRDVGRHFRVGAMLAKESVKNRISSDVGMSFTEFSYQVMQGFDFHYLKGKHGVSVQIGGSDQWGNITAGTELIRRLGTATGQKAAGLTFPLLTKSDGKKFGKTEDGAIWLSPNKMSPYNFYQHLYRVADADVIKLMRMITFMELAEIHEIENSMKDDNYVPNSAQKRLAQELTKLIHGAKGLEIAENVTLALKPGSDAKLEPAVFEALADAMPMKHTTKANVAGNKLIDVAVDLKLMPSKGEVRRMIENGGVYLNNRRVEDVNYTFADSDLIDDIYALLSIGKKRKFVISCKPGVVH